MATYLGNEGVVKVGSVPVGEVTEFKIEETAQMVEDSQLTDSWDTFKSGSRRWKGSLTCWFDPGDTAGQEALIPGATVTLGMYGIGVGTGRTYFSGSALIESRSQDVKKNGVVFREISFQGSGALAQATV